MATRHVMVRRGWGLGGLGVLVWNGVATLSLLTGCANPGQPKPPSLHLPNVVEDLSASRVGSGVQLRWTTPSTTTDKLPLPAKVWAVVCRQAGTGHGPCAEVVRMPVHAGLSEAEDALPAAMLQGAPQILIYRMELRNEAGRSAGWSSDAFAASGPAPAEVTELKAASARDGVRLTWAPVAPPTGSKEDVELRRTEASAAQQGGKRRSPGLPSVSKPSAEVRLQAGGDGQPDAGGAIDRTAQTGATYRYVAERVESLTVAGHALRLVSPTSAAATVTVRDTFAPGPPAGLEAAANGGQTPSIDLSWRPGAEADLAGYNIYRRVDGGAWSRLNAELVTVPGYTDATVEPGRRYAYRVTAVDRAGNESAPGAEVEETAETR